LDRIFARYHLGLMALIDAEPERAVAAFQSARDAAGRTTPRLALMMGAALERAGQTDAAAAFYDQAIAESGGDAALRAAKARLDAGGALAAPVADQAAAAAEALYGLAALLTPTGEERARTALLHAQIALYLAPDLHEARLVVGEAFSALERDDAALAAFEAVPEAAPEYVSAQSARASALARMEKSDAALEALAGIVDRAPSPARVQFTIADVYRRDQRFEECVSAFDAGFARLAEDETVTWPVHFYHGVCLERAADWEKAEAAFGTALDLSPDEPEVLNYLGYSLVEQRRRLDEALEMIERAVRGKPDAGHIVDSLGWALYRLGDYERAVVQLEKAVELEPVEPVINDHLGDALWKVGRRLEAEFQWRRALSFEPEDADRARILRKLDAGLDAVLEEEARASSGAEDAAEGVDEGALRDQLAPDGADADAPQGG
ncbi:MAG: tetratricopeptide repeat protein, partial [Pseudomonadota bacterium]